MLYSRITYGLISLFIGSFFCSCSMAQDHSLYENWKSELKSKTEEEMTRSNQECKTNEGDTEFWISELERYDLPYQFNQIDSLIRMSKEERLCFTHSMYYGYDTEWIPPTYYFKISDTVEAYIIENKTIAPYKDNPEKMLNHFEELKGGCDFNINVLTCLNGKREIEYLKVAANVELN